MVHERLTWSIDILIGTDCINALKTSFTFLNMLKALLALNLYDKCFFELGTVSNH